MTATANVAISRRARIAGTVGVLLVMSCAAALVTYKASGALRTIAKAQATGGLAPKAEWIATAGLSSWLRPLAGTANYFSWVLIALAFGVLLGALVRALIPQRWLARTLAARGPRGILTAAAAGTPLMLCSCCVAPLFDGVYARTRRLGPALGLMFAAPALNPAALVLTFLLFPRSIAMARLGLSLTIVLLAATALGRLVPSAPAESCVVDQPAPTWRGLAQGFWASLKDVAARALPAIALGAFLSMLLTQHVAVPELASSGRLLAVVLVAAVSVVIALPTFAEIPLALALLHAGAPVGAVVAVLVAGPVVNLPSLLTVRRSVSGRAALATGAVVFAITALGGVLMT